jgi:hypothetical protein
MTERLSNFNNSSDDKTQRIGALGALAFWREIPIQWSPFARPHARAKRRQSFSVLVIMDASLDRMHERLPPV